MARHTVLRAFLNVLTMSHKQKFHFPFGSPRLLQNFKYSTRLSSTAGNKRTEQEQREERIRRERRYVGLIIGSSVGLIGSLYFLFRRLTNTNAKAESKTPSIDSNSENNMDGEEQGDEETDAKRKKDKQGFRERRVRNYLNASLYNL